MGAASVKVVYIGGATRSGSTLLDRMLGEAQGFVSTGELRRVWDRGLVRNELCGCGVRFRQCGFWREVFRSGFGDMDRVDPQSTQGLMETVERIRYFPRLTLKSLRSREYSEQLARYTDTLSALYHGIQQVSGANVIVDSSKTGTQAWTLLSAGGIDPYVIHLVRDSRAVAYSQLKKRKKPEVTDRTAYMVTMKPRTTAWKWTVQNAQVQVLRWVKPSRYLRIRYEDLALDPGSVLARIGDHVKEEQAELNSVVDGKTVTLRLSHTVSGNPMRFMTGPLTVRPDEKWRDAMNKADRRTMTMRTWPLLLTYGYLGPNGKGAHNGR